MRARNDDVCTARAQICAPDMSVFVRIRPLCTLCPNCALVRGVRVRARTRKERKKPSRKRKPKERENPRAEAPNPQHKQNQHKPRAKPQDLEARAEALRNSIPRPLPDPPKLRNRSPSDPKKNLVALLVNALDPCLK